MLINKNPIEFHLSLALLFLGFEMEHRSSSYKRSRNITDDDLIVDYSSLAYVQWESEGKRERERDGAKGREEKSEFN